MKYNYNFPLSHFSFYKNNLWSCDEKQVQNKKKNKWSYVKLFLVPKCTIYFTELYLILALFLGFLKLR